MSDFEKSKSIWVRYFEVQRDYKNIERQDKAHFGELVIEYAKQQRFYVPHTKSEQLINKRTELSSELLILETELSSIPNSLDKAKGMLVAYVQCFGETKIDALEIACFVKDKLDNGVVQKIVSSIRNRRNSHVAYQRNTDRVGVELFGESSRFWRSDTLSDFYVYRFLETFELGEFSDMKEKIAERFRDSEGIQDLRNLWLLARSPALWKSLYKKLPVSLDNAVAQQNNEGWWNRHEYENRERIPEFRIEDTAMLSYSLLKMGIENSHREAGRKGIEWLNKNVKHTGFWGGQTTKKEDSSLLNTLIVVSALQLSNTPDLDNLVNDSKEWLKSQQDSRGIWNSSNVFTDIQITALVVETLESQSRNSFHNHYLSVSRDFLLLGSSQVQVDSESSIRLGLISIYHGLEFLLYACLDHINVAFIDSNDQTIGFRQAVTKLQTHYQDSKKRPRGEILEYRNKLYAFATLRDGIIHKANTASRTEALELYDVAFKFAELNCKRIFGFSLF
jgi:hypothetical protein